MRHLMGSTYFFGRYSDFVSHDTDYIELVSTTEFSRSRAIRGQGLDVLFLRRKPKDVLISEALSESLPMVVGKFLIPEFCEEIGFTIEDLPKVRPLIDRLDPKHTYEAVIYEAYLKNGFFTLTEEQRLEAYNSYRSSRGLPPH